MSTKNKNPLQNFIYKTEIKEKSKQAIARNCKAFGYLDGYFDEEIYIGNFECTEDNNANYERGYTTGTNDRLKETKETLQIEKTELIMKLAQYDGENNIAPRKISKKYKDIYKRNYYKVRCANSEMIDIFMYDDELTENTEEQVYTFGYMDGYFDECCYAYSLENEELISLYELGYQEGQIQKETNLSLAALAKLKWLVKMAINDSKLGIKNMLLSEAAKEIYENHYEEENKITKQIIKNPEQLYNGDYEEEPLYKKDEKLSNEEYLEYRRKRHKK